MKAKLREVLEKLVEPFAYPHDKNWQERTNPALAIARALAAIMEMMPRWVPVSERLPEVDEWVLGSAKLFPLVMRRFNPADGGGWFWQIWSTTGIVSGGNITHWMPIPAAPEAEKEES